MDAAHVDRLLARVREGDRAAEQELFAALHHELHALAGRVFRSQLRSHTLQPTALLNEAYLKMAGRNLGNDSEHFLAIAARAMRQVLVNHARDRSAQKRGGGDLGERVTLSGLPGDDLAPDLDVLSVNEALADLERLDPRQARVAELRLFGGLGNQEVAQLVGVSLRSVELDWKMAKAWLADRLGHPDG